MCHLGSCWTKCIEHNKKKHIILPSLAMVIWRHFDCVFYGADVAFVACCFFWCKVGLENVVSKRKRHQPDFVLPPSANLFKKKKTSRLGPEIVY